MPQDPREPPSTAELRARDLREVSYHEAGHVVVGRFLGDHVVRVEVTPTGAGSRLAGYWIGATTSRSGLGSPDVVLALYRAPPPAPESRLLGSPAKREAARSRVGDLRRHERDLARFGHDVVAHRVRVLLAGDASTDLVTDSDDPYEDAYERWAELRCAGASTDCTRVEAIVGGVFGVDGSDAKTLLEYREFIWAIGEERQRIRAALLLALPARERVAEALIRHHVIDGEDEIEDLVGPPPAEAVAKLQETASWVGRARRRATHEARRALARPR